MNPDRQRRVEALFHAALEHPPAERARFLEEACDDGELRGTVRTLLEEDAAAAAWFAGLAERTGALRQAMDARPEVNALAGRRVGPYLLEREVGRGGTSVVYASRRVDGTFDRTVAVKVLARRSGGADLRARFEREQQLLSGLNHPNIAAIHDGGVTEDDHPYFVMELVDGVPLDQYCDHRRLTIDERLRLFLTVTDAVHHAHRSLVIHRDLKPSNILVTHEGTVKLIDFGIARLVSDGAAGGGTDDATTRMIARWMTPEYGAPEQVRGERTTTATDVYQLGVVLYELLTGRHPISADAAESLYLTEKAVCETEPPRPSRAVTRPGGRRRGRDAPPRSPSDIARARRTEVRHLRQRLRGDVDAIILRSLQKDPALRYGSAEGLALDIRRYLDGRPVAAREGKVAYRTRKFIRRHRVPVAAAAITLLLLAGGGALHMVGIAGQRDIARVEAAKATTVTEFMLDLFHATHPGDRRGEDLTASLLLERGVERAEALADQPVVQAEMLGTIARAYHGLAELDRAEALFRRSLAIRRAHLPTDHPDIADGIAHVGWSRLMRNDFEVAAELFGEAAAIQRVALGPDHPELANSLQGRGLALNGLGQVDAGIALIEEAQAIRRGALPGPHPETANGLNDLAILVREKGDLPAAESLLVEALAMRRAALPPGHPDIGKSAQHLASLLHVMGELERAEPLYLEALGNWRRSLGATHPSTLSTVRSLAALYSDWGRPEDAGRYRLPEPTDGDPGAQLTGKVR